jgi:hypothetical protein
MLLGFTITIYEAIIQTLWKAVKGTFLRILRPSISAYWVVKSHGFKLYSINLRTFVGIPETRASQISLSNKIS